MNWYYDLQHRDRYLNVYIKVSLHAAGALWSTGYSIGLMIIRLWVLATNQAHRVESPRLSPWARLLTHIVPPYPGEKRNGYWQNRLVLCRRSSVPTTKKLHWLWSLALTLGTTGYNREPSALVSSLPVHASVYS